MKNKKRSLNIKLEKLGRFTSRENIQKLLIEMAFVLFVSTGVMGCILCIFIKSGLDEYSQKLNASPQIDQNDFPEFPSDTEDRRFPLGDKL